MLKNEFCVLSDNELELVAGGDVSVGDFVKDVADTMWRAPACAVYPAAVEGIDTGSGFFEDRKNAVKRAMYLDQTDKDAKVKKAAGITGVVLDGGIAVAGAAALVAAGVGVFLEIKDLVSR